MGTERHPGDQVDNRSDWESQSVKECGETKGHAFRQGDSICML